MLEITRQADYALRAVVEIARAHEGDRVPTASIAMRQKIPLPFLAKIISQLVVRGILTTTRGASGGVCLARDAHTITMCEVIEAIDGPIMINSCTCDANACEIASSCALREVFISVQQELVRNLDAVTMADLIIRSEALEAARHNPLLQTAATPA